MVCPSLREAITQFLNAKQIDEGLSKNSIDSYRSDLESWMEWMQAKKDFKDCSISEIKEEHLTHFLNEKKEFEKIKTSSLQRKASSFRQFFKFCALEFELENLPTEFLVVARKEERLPKALSLSEIKRLLISTNSGLPYTHQKQKDSLVSRDKAMLYLLYATGLRVSELIHLKPSNLDLDLCLVKTIGKGSKQRLVPFFDEARNFLEKYLNEHRPHLIPPSLRSSEQESYLFLTEKGAPLTRQGFAKILKKIAFTAEINPNVSPHWIRHSFATHLLEKGMSLRTLQLLLGHEDISTTQMYTDLSMEHLKSIHEKYHPRGGK